MTKIEFEEIKFDKSTNNIDIIRAIYLKRYYFELNKSDLNKIGSFTLDNGAIAFDAVSKKSASNKLNLLINNGFLHLKNMISARHTILIHKNSEIPLIGTQYFGLIDRNSSLVELRPSSSCNIDCIYCSVNEGKSGNHLVDYVVEKDYLVEEFKNLIKQKGCNQIEAHINPQGEPLLYTPLISLIQDISKIKEVNKISIDTNGTLLTTKLIDFLQNAGLTQINISLNAIDKRIADKIANTKYNVTHILDMIKYAKNKFDIIIAPVYLPGINDEEIEKIIQFCIDNSLKLGIQNFMKYNKGRNPVKGISMYKFYEKLKEWELKFNIKLTMDSNDFNIIKTKKLENPFVKGQKVKVKIMCQGRRKNEMLAIANNRVIQVSNCFKTNGKINITITRIKHNIIHGKHLMH
jgi:uncharacterized protein